MSTSANVSDQSCALFNTSHQITSNEKITKYDLINGKDINKTKKKALLNSLFRYLM